MDIEVTTPTFPTRERRIVHNGSFIQVTPGHKNGKYVPLPSTKHWALDVTVELNIQKGKISALLF